MPLDPKTSALVAIAYGIAKDDSSFAADIVAAISFGATEQELLEVLEVARGLGIEPAILESRREAIRHHFRRVD